MNKKKTYIIVLSLVLILSVIILGARCFTEKMTDDNKLSYEDLIFDTSFVHTIDVNMSEKDRTDQLAKPLDKIKYRAVVTIDGEVMKDVSFSTKGNSSLFLVNAIGSDRFSYKINFGKFKAGHTFHGLDKLNLQSNYFDVTSMKEYMAYWLFRRMGVDAPLSSYAWLRVNGEDLGLYTLIEEVEDSFLKRTADGVGTLYKPEAEGLALDEEEAEQIKNGRIQSVIARGGADLRYRDGNDSSYPEIFDYAQTKDSGKARANVIRSLKALAERENLDEYLDTEEIIKYFAVHNFLVSYDSYTGPMLHNYFLYEHDGKIAILPWDYDLSYGAFPADANPKSVIDSNTIVNVGIDTPLSSIPNQSRPMWGFIQRDEGYHKMYHDNLLMLSKVIESGEFEKEAERIHELILPYLKKDPKAVYTSEEIKKGYETLVKYIGLRARSVSKQTEGHLAPRSKMQMKEDKVDASEITIKDMGSLSAP